MRRRGCGCAAVGCAIPLVCLLIIFGAVGVLTGNWAALAAPKVPAAGVKLKPERVVPILGRLIGSGLGGTDPAVAPGGTAVPLDVLLLPEPGSAGL